MARKLGLVESRVVVEAILKAAIDRGLNFAGAVVDSGGEPIYLARVDGASPLNARMSLNKAYTATKWRQDTKTIKDRLFDMGLGDDRRDIAWFGDARFTPVWGGILLRAADGTVLGALGESGGTPAQDEEIGQIGARNSAEIARVMASYFRARDEFEPVSRDELLDRLRSGTATVLDVRPEDEFAHGHLPDALNIPLSQLERRLAELPADQEIIAYCRGPWCVLSFEAVALLRQRGYRVRRLEDGFPEWKMAGLPIGQKPLKCP